MTDVGERHQRIVEVFLEAVDEPADRRSDVVRAAAADRPDIIETVLRLLSRDAGEGAERGATGVTSHDESSGTGVSSGPDALRHAAPPEIPGFEVVGAVGSGGFGTVYLARQAPPDARVVAIKVAHPHRAADPRLVARFEVERHVLASLEHPNLAGYIGSGTTDDGRPYFVMEFIDGLSITAFADDERLDVRARVRLMVDVCRAVGHVNGVGVIHRDLTPRNVLVAMYDGRPVPRLIDFGIARILDTGDGPAEHTRAGEVLGSLTSMSPEQATGRAGAVDVRTDVYALGCMLYELLTGSSPLQLTPGESATDFVRRLEHEPAPTAAARMGSMDATSAAACAHARRTSVASLRRQVRNELGWICARALEKRPGARYQTVRDLGRDLERFLDREAIDATPPSVLHRCRALARRRPTLVSTTITAAVLIVAAGVLVSVLWLDARAAERLASDRLQAFTDAESQRLDQAYFDGIPRVHDAIGRNDLRRAGEHLAGLDVSRRRWEWRHLDRQRDLRARVLDGHDTSARSVAVSPDGRWLASSDEVSSVVVRRLSDWSVEQVWEVEGGGCTLRWVEGHELLVVGGCDGSIASFRVGEDRPAAAIRPFTTPVDGLGVRGDMLVASSQGTTVRTFDVTTLSETGAVDLGRHLILPGMTVLPDGRLGWGRQQFEIRRSLEDAPDAVIPVSGAIRCSAVDAERGRMALGLTTGEIVEVTLPTFEPRRTIMLRTPGTVWSVAYDPVHGGVAAAIDDGRVVLVDPDRSAIRPARELRGGDGTHFDLAFTPDGAWLVAACEDGSVSVWSTSTGRPAPRAPGMGSDRTLVDPDGRWVAGIVGYRSVRIRDLELGTPLGDLVGHAGHVWDVAVDATGDRIASASEDGTIRIWSGRTGTLRDVTRFPGPVRSVAFGPPLGDGAGWASAHVGQDGNGVRMGVIRWHGADGAVSWSHEHEDIVHDVAVSDDGRSVVAVAADGVGLVLDAPTGRVRTRWTGVSALHDVIVDERRGWAVGSQQRPPAIVAFDLDDGTEVVRLPVGLPSSMPLRMDLDPSGDRLVTALAGTVALWAWPSGEGLLTLTARASTPSSVAFDPTGRWLAVNGGTLRWDTTPESDAIPEAEAIGRAVQSAAVALRARPELEADGGLVDVAIETRSSASDEDASMRAIWRVADERRRVGLDRWRTDVDAPFARETVAAHRPAYVGAAMDVTLDGRLAAMERETGRVALVDAATGADRGWLAMPVDHHHSISDLRFAPDGVRLVALHARGMVEWDVASGRVVHTVERSGGEPDWTIARAIDDGVCLVGTAAGRVEAWRSAVRIGVLAGSVPGSVVSLDALRDGSIIAAAGSGASGDDAQLWRGIEDEAPRSIGRAALGLRSTVRSVAIDPTGTWLGLGTGGGAVTFRRLDAVGEPRPMVERVTSSFNVAESFGFSSDGRFALVAHRDGFVTVWRPETAEVLGVASGHELTDFGVFGIRRARFAGDGSFVLTVGPGAVRWFDAAPLLDPERDRQRVLAARRAASAAEHLDRDPVDPAVARAAACIAVHNARRDAQDDPE